jgi:hypothetical protein
MQLFKLIKMNNKEVKLKKKVIKKIKINAIILMIKLTKIKAKFRKNKLCIKIMVKPAV